MKKPEFLNEKKLISISKESFYKKKYKDYNFKKQLEALKNSKSFSTKMRDIRNVIVDNLDDFLMSNDDFDFSKNNLTITKNGDEIIITVNNIREEKIKKIFKEDE
jgi:hypothetical protein